MTSSALNRILRGVLQLSDFRTINLGGVCAPRVTYTQHEHYKHAQVLIEYVHRFLSSTYDVVIPQWFRSVNSLVGNLLN